MGRNQELELWTSLNAKAKPLKPKWIHWKENVLEVIILICN